MNIKALSESQITSLINASLRDAPDGFVCIGNGTPREPWSKIFDKDDIYTYNENKQNAFHPNWKGDSRSKEYFIRKEILQKLINARAVESLEVGAYFRNKLTRNLYILSTIACGVYALINIEEGYRYCDGGAHMADAFAGDFESFERIDVVLIESN